MTAPEQPQDGAADDQPAPADPKARFREALARKQAHGGGAQAPRGGPVVHPHASPAKPQRTFRRKSG